jgi:hypothetical protein
MQKKLSSTSTITKAEDLFVEVDQGVAEEAVMAHNSQLEQHNLVYSSILNASNALKTVT